MIKIWQCKIGELEEAELHKRWPNGADSPMRHAIREAYLNLTGQEPKYIFSGWGATLTRSEREVVDNVPGDECLAMHRVREARFREAVLEATRDISEKRVTPEDAVDRLIHLFNWADA